MPIELKSQLESEFNKKFMCTEKFAREVEDLVKNDNDLDYIGAIIYYCEKNNIHSRFICVGKTSIASIGLYC